MKGLLAIESCDAAGIAKRNDGKLALSDFD